MNLKTFWKRKTTYRFILKSGAHFDIRADSCTYKYKTDTTEFHAYELKGIVGPSITHLVIGEIAAIITL
jgi:hypothetical protein